MLIQKPNRWSCLATSFSMVLGISVDEFCQLVGHNGSDIVRPNLPDPLCRRGFHVQEAINVCWYLGFSSTPFELYPSSIIASDDTPLHVLFGEKPKHNWLRFESHIREGRGVIECAGRLCNHAVAFDRGVIYDPDGKQYRYDRRALELSGLYMQRLWRVEAM